MTHNGARTIIILDRAAPLKPRSAQIVMGPLTVLKIHVIRVPGRAIIIPARRVTGANSLIVDHFLPAAKGAMINESRPISFGAQIHCPTIACRKGAMIDSETCFAWTRVGFNRAVVMLWTLDADF